MDLAPGIRLAWTWYLGQIVRSAVPASITRRADKANINISERFLKLLRHDLTFRRIERGIRLLNANQDLLNSCGPWQENAAVLLGYVARWVEVGFADSGLIRSLLARFPDSARGTLPAFGYMHLRMADGFNSMVGAKYDEAIRHFECALAIEQNIEDNELRVIGNYWTGRCLMRQGRYSDALGYVAKSRKAALELNPRETTAVVRVLEGRIVFEQGNSHEAEMLLGEAEKVLANTDDYITRGNIDFVYGKIAAQKGKYEQALQRFTKAIEEYERRDPHLRNFARCEVSIAIVKRLLAMQIRDRIDRAAERRRGSQTNDASRGGSTHQYSKQYLMRLREEALEHLRTAYEVFERHNDYRGKGEVYVAFGYLHLDHGNLDAARSQGAAAYRLGDEKTDNVLRGWSRILQSAVECARFDERIEDAGSEQSAQFAIEFAREALEFAKSTQDRNLLAAAYIALGLAHCVDISENMEEARLCSDKAEEILEPDNQGLLFPELLTLKRKLRSAESYDSIFRDWSQGLVGSKTFQEVSEEFAAIVIPKVWRREGYKISRVAARLSISPKKVRRILRRQGISQTGK